MSLVKYSEKMKFLIFLVFICDFNNLCLSISNEPSKFEYETKNVNSSDILPESKFFLNYFFKKYGNEEKISYEGFEHLLESLGLAQLKFEKHHTLDEHKTNPVDFQEVHDELMLHKHQHLLDRKERNSGNYNGAKLNSNGVTNTRFSGVKLKKLINKGCFTPEEMLVIYNLEPNHQVGISHLDFLQMCPILIYELDRKSCESAAAVEGKVTVNTNIYYVWLSAFASVLIISLVGLFGVCLVPLLQKAFFNELLGFLVAVAVGTLCGDALLHLLPHAFQKDEEFGSDSVALRAGCVFLTIVVFYLFETVLLSRKTKEDNATDTVNSKQDVQVQEKSTLHIHGNDHGHSHGNVQDQKNGRTVSAIACMVIMGDGLHNLTDGLAIGAAFSGDLISGFTTAIAVFTHELPHELGDFAILIQSGMTTNQAVFYNIISSILSFIGVAVGLFIGNISSASQWIYAITAGVFLYIGLVNLVPEMKKTVNGERMSVAIQVAGMVCGGTIMFLIALFEHDLEHIFFQ